MRSFLALVLVLSLGAPAWACLWYYGTNVHGEPAKISERDPATYLEHLTDDRTHREIAGRIPPPVPSVSADFKARSDHAATLVHRGEAGKAVEILEAVEKEKPGEYVVAANLGTAYELTGNNEKALEWIRECLKRNAQSHYGTEWLHERILQAKIALAKDPKWLETHTVLGMDFGAGPAPSMPPTPAPLGGRSVRSSLEYQLHERMAFVKAPDPVVADLLVDLANLLALELTVEHAIPVYDLALTYRPARADRVEARRNHLRGRIAERKQREDLKLLAIIGACVLGAAGVVGIWVRFRARRAPN